MTESGASLGEKIPTDAECAQLANAARETAKGMRVVADQADKLATVMETKPGLDVTLAAVKEMTDLCASTTTSLERMFESTEFTGKAPSGFRHVVEDPESKCDCRECWYTRGYVEACNHAMKLVGDVGDSGLAEQIRALKPQYKVTVNLKGFETDERST